MICKLCGERDLPLFYTQANEDEFRFAAQQAGLVLAHWETYAVNPLKYFVYRHLPMGNKARAMVKRAIS